MNRAPRQPSIHRKITAVIMATSGIALLLACAALFAFQAWHIKNTFMSELSTTGRIVADNVAVAAMFNDEEKAAQILRGLQAMPQVEGARLVLDDGVVLAKLGSELVAPDAVTSKVGGGLESNGTQMLLAQPVERDGKHLGTLAVLANFRSSYASLLMLYSGILGIVLVGSLLFAFFISGRLQHLVTGPILRLALTARQIADNKDYTVRAEKTAADEVGTLTDAFNRMLDEIHEQDAALQGAHSELQEQLASLEREVNERKAAEEALRQSQEKLVETSRLAGMAEVATNVLHNVGNVLNSVNVSSNMINERIRGSKIAALERITNMVAENREHFAEFVSNDQRGQRLPDLLTSINTAMREEQSQLITEVSIINNHISHIKEIVAMQQSYSRVGGLVEQLSVEDLVEDAMRINGASISRHHINLVRDFETVPTVSVDRHRALQILVNLFSNAKHAVSDSKNEEKNITIKIRNNGGHFVKLIVQDNGVGIPQENLTRIFSHGFTTKKTGHGFGLHSGALAAAELGGSLHATSDGPGHGAVFTLELPIESPSATAPSNS